MNSHAPFQNKCFRRAALASIAALAISSATNSFAVETSATAPAEAEVVQPIAIAAAAGTKLSFGTFSAGATEQTVTVTTDGSPTASGDVVLVGGTTSAAQFDVTGESNAGYAISVSTTTLSDGASTPNTMALSLTHDVTAGGSTNPATGTLDATGNQSIYVGGVLTVAASQAPGTYSGTITATVDYN